MKQGILLILIITVTGLLAACSGGVVQPQTAQAGVTQAEVAQPEAAQAQELQIETAQAQPAAPAFETQWNDEKAVRIEVTPLNLPQGGASLDFSVVFDTHSVDLGFDPVAISVLRDNTGREYPALEWKGDGPGGHHRSGTLRFEAPNPSPKSVEVVIRDVAKVPERAFRWSLTDK
ncbi:MAG: hypothetical protein BroJett011_13560 [Chloroflexota bacterium]|nr:MAG: hypothetical protein BroJett011_13560 [Chloroflexota bacterium]